MAKIRKLPAEIVNLIAAGEVVERPASVVKEILENSIDAGADNIRINIEDGGKKLIEIIDNGEGMDKADARLAFTQHATSKIFTAQDLDKIRTFGFRGEALASISAVSSIDIETKREEEESIGLRIVDQQISDKPTLRTETGTTLSIRHIFKNTPGRQKFLRTEQTELNHITETFIQTALVNLNIRFELYHNHKLLYRLPPVNTIAERGVDIWRDLDVKHLIEIESQQGNIRVSGYVGLPEAGRKSRSRQYLFVNGRPISDRLVQKAIADAYRGFLHKDLQPVYFLQIDLPPEEVDVNVHPRKMEVKFQQTNLIYTTIYNCVHQKLHSVAKQKITTATTAEEASEQQNTHIEPSADNRTSNLYDSTFTKKTEFKSSPKQVYKNTSTKSASRNLVNKSLNFSKQLLLKSPETEYGTKKSQDNNEAQKVLPWEQTDFIKPFQFFNTYIAYQKGESIIFIDQHAAAEKILYEKLMKNISHAETMKMLVPEVLELDVASHAQVLANSDQLKNIGIEIADFGGHSIQVISKPAATPNLRSKEFIHSWVEKSQDYDNNTELLNRVENEQLHYLVATAACHGSVRAGQRLNEAEMTQIISDLNKCEYPYNCPHGRPVIWQMTRAELEKNFKRII